MSSLPKTMHALQLTGEDELRLNPSKEIPAPGPHQLLCQVEAVGLCFSDLKLLKQFSAHPRKSGILKGIDSTVLQQIPSYVPEKAPTVPGHEAVIRIVAAGPETHHKVGERALVQTDYRWLPTNGSNASFGYNFEGGLQEYVLMDERVIFSPEGESMLIPVREELSASAVGLIEPWACVENAYVSPERKTAAPAGRMLVVVDEGRVPKGVAETFAPGQPPAAITVVAGEAEADRLAEELKRKAPNSEVETSCCLHCVEGAAFDDILYFGSDSATIEQIDKLLAPKGLLNLILGGRQIGRPVTMGVGRVHYGGMRFIGTTGDDASESLRTIPAVPDIRTGEKILVVGAAGPMGLMHVVRDLCQGVPNVELVATDFDDARLAALDEKAKPLAEANGVAYRSVNPGKEACDFRGSYTALMVPVPALVAKAVVDSLPDGIINIFAGIPAGVCHEIDMDAYVAKRLYFIGTSGSVIRDMKIVLGKVDSGRLDTNISVAAVSGMCGAIDGIRAVENRTIAGKIIIYPMLHDMPLTTLQDLETRHPSVHARLRNGQWTAEAEKELLNAF
jgi:threonine dehydrogenase-like Zn-dependent dehydrogenase